MKALQESLFDLKTSKKNEDWFQGACNLLDISQSAGWPDKFGENLYHSLNIQKPIKVLSLFSGAGGLDIGFQDAGFTVVECNEIEKLFASTLQMNTLKGKKLESTNIVCKDIREYSPNLENIEFIIGGPPCQTFSAAGARAAGVNGTDDERGMLFQEYVRIVDSLKPKGFLFENVYRIVGAQNGRAWTRILESFSNIGYKLYWKILDSADYGVPQHRERLFIIGLHEGEYLFPLPTHGPDSISKLKHYTAGDAICDLPKPESFSPLNGRHGYLLEDIPPGLNYSFYTERMRHPTPYFSWRSKFSDYLYKADPQMPVRTLKAQGGQYTGPFHWDNRVFTLEELKRLQTFPDDYIIQGNRQQVIHQLGNSVPPQLARILALSILKQVFKINLPFKMDLMPHSYKLGFRARKNKLTHLYAQKAKIALEGKKNDNSLKSLTKEASLFFEITEDLRLTKKNSGADLNDFHCHHIFENKSLHICVRDASNSDNPAYEIDISPPVHFKFKYLKSIKLYSYSVKEKGVLVGWKYLELLLKEGFHKDDLVQFFGYYQSKKNYDIKIKLNSTKLLESSLWKVFQKVSEGIGVGQIATVSDFSRTFELNEHEVHKNLKLLKNIGFEIRSKNTNSQIPEDSMLIPYPFPTLNSRSLQRLKEL